MPNNTALSAINFCSVIGLWPQIVARIFCLQGGKYHPRRIWALDIQSGLFVPPLTFWPTWSSSPRAESPRTSRQAKPMQMPKGSSRWIVDLFTAPNVRFMPWIHRIDAWGCENALYRGNGLRTFHLWGVQLLFLFRGGRNLTTNWTYWCRQIGCRCIFHGCIGSAGSLYIYGRWKLPGGEKKVVLSQLLGACGISG